MQPTPELIDLSHAVHDGLVTYPGMPAPVIGAHLSREASRAHYAEGVEFHIGRIEMVANTGTYLDSPFHRYRDGADLAALPLHALAALPATVLDVRDSGERGITAGMVRGVDVAGRAILVRTGWDAHWGTPRYGEGNPFLTEGAARHLAGAGAALVGIDSLNVDDPSDGRRPAHSILLAAGIPIVEHLCNLGALGDRPFRFFAVPVMVRGLGSFPVRAFALRDAADPGTRWEAVVAGS
ncbi:MAG TPA: cyclase family protein [Actinomycetes bacterium]|nr:cyclase family protein [Actinomycetes bacterium]